LKPCHRPLIACLAEPKLVAGFWLREGNAQCTDQAPEIISQLLEDLPQHIRIGCVRADAGFYHEKVLQLLEKRGLNYIVAMRLYDKWQKYCRHAEAAWTPTDIEGIDVQEIEGTVLVPTRGDCAAAFEPTTGGVRQRTCIGSWLQ